MNWDGSNCRGRSFWKIDELRRIPEEGRVSGVCAGIAAHFQIRRKWVRVGAVLALIFMPVPTLILYALASFLLKPASPPPSMSAATGAAQKDDWASGDLPPDLSFANLKRKFRDLEERAGAMENQVTSQEFGLRRDFKQMGEA